MRPSQYNLIENHGERTLVMNAKTGAILSLDKQHAESMCRMVSGTEWEPDELREALLQGGMLLEDDRDEKEEMKAIGRLLRFSNRSLGMTIAPTLECNFCCPYCYEKGQRKTTMTPEVEDRLVSFVKERSRGLSELEIGWYGGEPLLQVDKIQRLTERIKAILNPECSYSASIVTNGYLLTPEVAETLAACDVKMAQITLDGSRKDHDFRRFLRNGQPTYDAILDNVSKVTHLLDISIRCNVDAHNIAGAGDLLDALEEKGLKNKVGFYLAPVDNINDTCPSDSSCFSMEAFSREELDFYSHAVDRGFYVDLTVRFNPAICGAVCAGSFVVDPEGYLYKCWDEIGMRERCVGTLAEGPRMNAQLVQWLNYEPSDHECEECFAYPSCMGGCPNHALHGGSKQCVSQRYQVRQRMILTEKAQRLLSELDSAHV